jgi:enhancing lycopene biosynthesis protein 2
MLRTIIRQFASKPTSLRNVAVVLSGCGVYDGSEIHEASACLVHLSRHSASVRIFAPDIPQKQVINHLTGEAMPETRNVLTESARIARGGQNISSLDKLQVNQFQAIILPGGFGAAKNLSTFAFDGDQMTVNDQLAKILKDFLHSKKPIGMCCISPVIAAKLFPGVKLTLGKMKNLSENEAKNVFPYSGAVMSARQMGADTQECDINEVCVDDKNRLITTPAFMKNASFHEVYDGVGLMVEKVIQLIDKK